MQYEKKIQVNNDVLFLTIPIDLAKFIGITKDSTVIMQDENGKHGRYVSFWLKNEKRKK